MSKDGPLNILNSKKLQFYALFKQGTIGNCNQPRPSIFNMIKRDKWDSWILQNGVDKTKAKRDYVANIQKIFDKVGEKIDSPAVVSVDTPDEQSYVLNQNTTTTRELNVANKTTGILSDDKFMDAFENPVEQPNYAVEASSQNISLPSTLTSVVNNFEFHISALMKQINVLNISLVEHRSVVANFMNRIIRIRRRGVQGVSWWMFAFFLLWPFISQLLLQYLLRRFFRV